MKIDVYELEHVPNKEVAINGNVYIVGCVTSYGGILSGVKKFHLRPVVESLDCLSFIVWDNNCYYRIVNDNKSWKDKS